MNVLGIETSCDETAASVVRDGAKILSNVVSSSLEFHKKYGGIIPEIAFRKQLETIQQVSDTAVNKAKMKLRDIGLISVTSCPGLFGSLIVGNMFAKTLSYSLNIPLIEVDHLYGHVYASFLNEPAPKFPLVALVVSGGHTSLFLAKDFDNFKLLGATLDDASGEAFDKVAKILGLGYPGGPVIEKIAHGGNGSKIRFKCCDTKRPLDFSFSGIKTAVLYYVRKNKKLSRNDVKDIAASFQESVVNALAQKAFLCCNINRVKNLVVAGGVAANGKLRETFLRSAKVNNINIYFPPKSLCTDNASMIAGLGYQLYRKRKNRKKGDVL
ncbi:MAG: tRNA (adenosine(37)-N6)-threonylcarbamoyltransferase complex transferase subunit TsaD [Candidatus Omnitrophota bacterium]|jgi:N6-L-threonylcarbamoyladenine synthase|nr:MAG: tRNA (adenosine(37)-N6)-threonylcarbamoyltransferase complex transferase subunit TsaD [Candidatus Omnitrophota bacterium]